MDSNKKKLIEAMNENVETLRQALDRQQSLLGSILEQNLDGEDLQAVLNLYPSPSREMKLKKALQEAIEVLEESRKSFKSKRLEALRKQLTCVLIDAE